MEQADVPAQRDGSIEVFGVIEALIGRVGYGWGVRELAEQLGASRSTVNRILAKLVEERLVSRDVSGAYIVGPRLKVLSRTLHEHHPLFSDGGRILSQLSKETGATALLAIASHQPEECFVLISSEPDSPVRYTLKAGTRLPTHAGALGLAILSRRGTQGLPEHLKKFTDDSMETRARVEEALRAYSSIGAVVSIGQHIPDAAGLAVPISLNNHLVGSISLSRPKNDFDENAVPQSAEMLRRAAAELEAALQEQTTQTAPSGNQGRSSSTLIERISRLLTELCLRPLAALGPGQLASVVGAGSVASRRLAQSAGESGLMSRLGPRAWAAGPTLLRWAAALGPHAALTELIGDDLRELSEATGETVGLALLDPESGTAHVAATHTTAASGVRYVLESGSRIPLHAGAAGKAILAYLPQQVSDEITLEPFTERTITNLDALKADLEQVRARGWATGEGERIPEAHGTAAPFFINGKVRGSITITVPRYRMQDIDSEDLAEAVVSSAAKITRLLSTENLSRETPQGPQAPASQHIQQDYAPAR
jgi:DNA-binding IclR family transcriptional regulator